MRFVVIRKKQILKTGILIALIAVFSLMMITPVKGVFSVNAKRKVPIYSVCTEEKKIAISFDCAWGVDYTDKLLSVMEKEKVKCTFFMVEFWAKKYPEYVKKIDNSGHEIGTHTSTHPHMKKLSRADIVKELTTSVTTIEGITGKKVELFRPPYGEYNDTVIESAENLGLYTIEWSVDSLDWKGISASEIYDRVVKKVQNGSIVLFHNQGEKTADALPKIIKDLKEKGFTFVPIGELIYRDNYKIDNSGKQIKNN